MYRQPNRQQGNYFDGLCAMQKNMLVLGEEERDSYRSLFELKPQDKAIAIEDTQKKRTSSSQIIEVAVLPNALILAINYLLTRYKWSHDPTYNWIDEDYSDIFTSSLASKAIRASQISLKDWLLLGMRSMQFLSSYYN